jgi:predicted lactoylglutathione lyase
MQQRISLITLGVADLAAARTFYEALGWQGAQQPDDEVVFFQAGGMVFALWTALAGRGGGPGVELAHNVGSPEEVDALLAEVKAAGGTIAREAGKTEWGGYSGAFADPDGYIWEVAHNPGWTLNEDGTITLV